MYNKEYFMKYVVIFLGTATLASLMILVGCGGPSYPDSLYNVGKVTYSGVNQSTGNSFELVITENKSKSARYAPQSGDFYALTVKGAFTGASSGTVANVSGGTLTLRHINGTTFPANISGSDLQ
jgi:hypothetical protein